MRHMKEITIDKFRGIEGLTLKDLREINLIVGDNNVGKTSILEAVQCFETPWDINSIVWGARSRGKGGAISRANALDCFMSLFPYTDQEHEFTVSVEDQQQRHVLSVEGVLGLKMYQDKQILWDEDENSERRFPIEEMVEREDRYFSGTLTCDGETHDIELRSRNMGIQFRRQMQRKLFNIVYVTPMDHMLQLNITKNTVEHKEKITQLLKIFDQDIVGFELVQDLERGIAIEYINHKKLGLVPLYTFGDGLKRVMKLASSIVQARDGILLIDEIETSMHVSILPEVGRWIAKACKEFNVQIIATTHSLEALSMMAAAMVEDVDQELVVYKIERYKKFYGKRYSEEQMDDIVNRQGLDVR